jgi:Winged helix DNA-binding domain
MFVVPIDVAATMDVACAQPIAARERTRLIALVQDQGIARNGERWLARVEEQTLVALRDMREATAAQLSRIVPELQHKLSFGEGKKWAGTIGMSTRVLFLLAGEGRVVRGRPLGSWISSQYRWVPTEMWLGRGLPEIALDEARADLVRRWLRVFGPGTANDIKWWTGWTLRQTMATLQAIDAAEVQLESGSSGYALPDDLHPTRQPPPWVALLPGLDPTVMGWKDRDWYLGDKAKHLFDRNGNAGPTVWADGRIVGGWVQRADGSVVVELLERVGRVARESIDEEAARVAEWLGDMRFTSRFASPLEKALRSKMQRSR